MTLKRVYGPHIAVELQWDMVYGQNFMVHLVLKVDQTKKTQLPGGGALRAMAAGRLCSSEAGGRGRRSGSRWSAPPRGFLLGM